MNKGYIFLAVGRSNDDRTVTNFDKATNISSVGMSKSGASGKSTLNDGLSSLPGSQK